MDGPDRGPRPASAAAPASVAAARCRSLRRRRGAVAVGAVRGCGGAVSRPLLAACGERVGYLPTSPPTSPYLPIPPHTSLYLPIPPHTSPYLAACGERASSPARGCAVAAISAAPSPPQASERGDDLDDLCGWRERAARPLLTASSEQLGVSWLAMLAATLSPAPKPGNPVPVMTPAGRAHVGG